MRNRRWRSAGVLSLAAAIAGCGGAAQAPTGGSQAASTGATGGSQTASTGATGGSQPTSTGPTGGSQTTTTAPTTHARPGTPPSSGTASTSAEVAVIRNWSSELARGNVAAASRYFATPSVIQVDPNIPAVTLRTMADVRAANQAFPCGARLLSAQIVHGYVDALFVLGNRPGGGPGGCGSGTGLTARVAFVIRSGRIAEWRRIPDEPGDAAHRSPGAQAPPAGQPVGPGVSAV